MNIDLLVKKIERDRMEAEVTHGECSVRADREASREGCLEYRKLAYVAKGKKDMCEDILRFIQENE